jgi:hypothetical protein
MLYIVLGSDGKEYGPADLEDLRGWVADGRMDSFTRVRPENSPEWKCVREFPDLRPLLSSIPPPGASRPVSKSLAMTGFVLGLFALVLGPLTGLPGLVCSLLAHHRARRMPESYGGAAWAMGGFVLSSLGMLLCVTVVPNWIMAASGSRTQSLICRVNLKHIGVALGTWNKERQGYPFQVSTNAGGSLEFCAAGPDGFDTNNFRHFAVMAEQLYSPRTITCPKDRTVSPAPSFVRLGPDNVSYKLRTGTNAVDLERHGRVLAVCPSHGYVLLTDGRIETVPPIPDAPSP